MAENSKIEWTDHTFNPWEGCQKVGPGCDNCYAEARDIRFTGGTHWGPGAPRRLTSRANWNKPLRWDSDAAKAGTRPRVFCASLADVFDNAVDPQWREDLWRLIQATPHLDWLLLTKRPGNIGGMLPTFAHWGNGWPNVWLGCTVVNQDEADRDIPKLLAVPAAVRFLSMEPLLGPVDLSHWMGVHHSRDNNLSDPETRAAIDTMIRLARDQFRAEHGNHGISWIIVGGESGPHARPMHPDWARSLRDQCAAAGVAFLFKQWGEWGPCDHLGEELDGMAFGCFGDAGQWLHPVDQQWANAGRTMMFRAGKARAGRTLDGVTHDGFPGVSA